MPLKPAIIKWYRRERQASSILPAVGEVHQPVFKNAKFDVEVGEDLAKFVPDDIDDCLEVELRSEPLLDGIDDGQLRRALLGFLQQALRLVEQSRVLERHAHAAGERLQQSNVGRTERMLAFHVDDIDRPASLITCHQRHDDRRLLHVGSRHQHAAIFFDGSCHVVVDEQRLAGAHYVRREASAGHRLGVDRHPLAVLENIRKVDRVRHRVVNANADVSLIEDLANLVADGVIDSLHVEFGRERLLHAIDDRKLGVALLGFLQEALRLVEQAGVLERAAERR